MFENNIGKQRNNLTVRNQRIITTTKIKSDSQTSEPDFGGGWWKTCIKKGGASFRIHFEFASTC